MWKPTLGYGSAMKVRKWVDRTEIREILQKISKWK
jgi:hypothetical protein